MGSHALMKCITWVQPDWSMQLKHVLGCYDVILEEFDEDPRNINIPESEEQHEVEGPSVEIPDILEPLHTNQVNIGSNT